MVYLASVVPNRLLILAVLAAATVGVVGLARYLPRRSRSPRPESDVQRDNRFEAARSLGLEGEGWILFTSSTCAPCKRVRTDLIASASPWIEVDVDQHPEMFRLWNVYRVPTLIWMNNSGRSQERHGPSSARDAIAAR